MNRRLVMTADAVGGVWTYAVELARALPPLGWDVTLALLGLRPDSVPADLEVVDSGAALDWLAESEREVEGAAAAVAELARERRADLVQLNSPALAGLASWPSPVIAVAHGDAATWWDAVGEGPLPPALRWIAALNRRGLAAADLTVAPSAAFAADVARVHRLSRRPEVVHNGRAPLGASIRPETRRAVFTAGRLWDRAKDLASYDLIAARLAVPVEAAGPLSGPQGERIELHHASALGVLDGEALAAKLSGRPIAVSTARFEPFGLAVLEAAQAGCPLVLSDLPSFRELWDGAARFVAPGDAPGFASAIEALLGDDAARDRAGRQAAERARRYTPARTANAMAALYMQLIDRAAGRAAA